MDAPHDEADGTAARVRPRNLIYAVDEQPPPPHLLALGLQYAVLVSIYLVLVVIVVRHPHVPRETAVSVVSLATVAIAIGTALPALPAHAGHAGDLRHRDRDALAIGLIAAVALTLIFRLGTRQSAKLLWASHDDPTSSGTAFIKATAAGWKVTASAVERCVADAERLVAYLRHLAPSGSRAEINLTFDGIDLVFDLRVAGHEPLETGPRAQAAAAVQGDTDNEEAAMIVGLQNFLGTIYTDRKRAYRRAGQVGVRPWFAT